MPFFFTIHTVFVRKEPIVRWSFALTRVVLALPNRGMESV
jgi:hypothetical protein